MTIDKHALGYVVGDTVRIFGRNGFCSGVAEKITKTGRLNVRMPGGVLRQFNAAGREIGAGIASDWSGAAHVDYKDQQEKRAEEIRVEARRRRRREEFKERLRDLSAKDPIHEKAEIVEKLREILRELA
jgi:hypothetical protein